MSDPLEIQLAISEWRGKSFDPQLTEPERMLASQKVLALTKALMAAQGRDPDARVSTGLTTRTGIASRYKPDGA